MHVLSIQSQVIDGHVGNSAAQFALQRQGFEAWAVPTAVLSHHPGHGRPAGRTLAAAEIEAFVDSLARQDRLKDAGGMLSGWLGSAGNARAAMAAAARVKALNPAAPWLLDPVIGDEHAGVYVAPELADFLRSEALPMADIVTPNRFEAEFLAERKIATLADALAVADTLRRCGPGVAVITSLDANGAAQRLATLAVSPEGAWLAATPRLADPPNGAGDLFAALFLARRLKGRTVKKALAFAVAATFGVLKASIGARELNLVAAQEELVAPSTEPEVKRVR
jgi:pyridoxine kinase